MADNISFHSINTLNIFQLKYTKKSIILWALFMFAVMFLYMSVFEYTKEMAKIKMDAMPKGMLEFMGMENMTNFSNYTSYFAVIYNIMLIPLSIFACVYTGSLFYKEEKNRTIEFLYAQKISRREIFISKIITSFLALLLVELAAFVPVIICGFAFSRNTFSIPDFILVVKISGFLPFIFLFLTSFLAGITGKINSGFSGSMVVLLSYIIGFLSKILGENGEFLKYFSPFQLFMPENVINDTGNIYAYFIIYFAISMLLTAIGLTKYCKRDFKL